MHTSEIQPPPRRHNGWLSEETIVIGGAREIAIDVVTGWAVTLHFAPDFARAQLPPDMSTADPSFVVMQSLYYFTDSQRVWRFSNIREAREMFLSIAGRLKMMHPAIKRRSTKP